MTEMQAIIGKVQLGKLKTIIKKNKERYLILEKILKSKFKVRKIPKKSSQTYEAFIFEVNSRKRSKIIKLLSQKGFGTKNLPDAIVLWQGLLPGCAHGKLTSSTFVWKDVRPRGCTQSRYVGDGRVKRPYRHFSSASSRQGFQSTPASRR